MLPHMDLKLVIPGKAGILNLRKKASYQYRFSCGMAICLPYGLSCDRLGTHWASVNGIYAPACLGYPGVVPG